MIEEEVTLLTEAVKDPLVVAFEKDMNIWPLTIRFSMDPMETSGRPVVITEVFVDTNKGAGGMPKTVVVFRKLLHAARTSQKVPAPNKKRYGTGLASVLDLALVERMMKSLKAKKTKGPLGNFGYRVLVRSTEELSAIYKKLSSY